MGSGGCLPGSPLGCWNWDALRLCTERLRRGNREDCASLQQMSFSEIRTVVYVLKSDVFALKNKRICFGNYLSNGNALFSMNLCLKCFIFMQVGHFTLTWCFGEFIHYNKGSFQYPVRFCSTAVLPSREQAVTHSHSRICISPFLVFSNLRDIHSIDHSSIRFPLFSRRNVSHPEECPRAHVSLTIYKVGKHLSSSKPLKP